MSTGFDKFCDILAEQKLITCIKCIVDNGRKGYIIQSVGNLQDMLRNTAFTDQLKKNFDRFAHCQITFDGGNVELKFS